MKIKQLILCTSLVVLSSQASAIMNIRPKPVDGHQHNRNANKEFILTGVENSQVKLFTPQLESSEIKIIDNVISFKPTGKDNYHALVAQREYTDSTGIVTQESAIRYVYMNGKPTGRSPSELTQFIKTPLEIVPDPLPREHWHYKAGDTINFVVRFNSEILADQPVSLSTGNGTVLKGRTNIDGEISFQLPDDFPSTQAGRRNNPASELLLHTTWSHEGEKYASWLSSDYQVDPSHWRHTDLGAWITTGGFIFGAFITGLGFRNKTASRKKK
ncbi:MAG TPA: hypothetical protein VIQ03_09590 [Gammaproteobacteria bacterium]